MIATDKEKVTVYLDPAVNTDLRVLTAKHRGSTLSSITQDMIEHCKGNHQFLDEIKAKYSSKKEEEYDI